MVRLDRADLHRLVQCEPLLGIGRGVRVIAEACIEIVTVVAVVAVVAGRQAQPCLVDRIAFGVHVHIVERIGNDPGNRAHEVRFRNRRPPRASDLQFRLDRGAHVFDVDTLHDETGTSELEVIRKCHHPREHDVSFA